MSFFQQLLQLITAPFRWLFSLPMAVISAPRRLWGLSLPARIAWVTALLLLSCAVVALVSVWRAEDRADPWNYLQRWEMLLVVLLLVVIPPLVYYAVRAWLEGEVSRYPDIDQAWQAGLTELAQNGIDPTEVPLFLILGAGDERLIKSLFQASGLDLAVRHAPPGRAALHWYATGDAVFLICRGVGHLSAVTGLALPDPPAAPPAGLPGGPRGTAAAALNVRGTLGGLDAGEPFDSGLPDDAPRGADIRGTLVPGGFTDPGAAAPGGRAAPIGGGLPRREADEQIDRLRYVCRLLARLRQPLCPLNGTLTVLPLRVVSDVLAAKDIPAAVQNDLAAVREVAHVRCSVTALVSGMEAERGFGELVRRVGAARAKANRFGKGFQVWNPPTAENLDAFSAHACGAFEDWVYNLFREPDGLSKPGNARLYSLLCRIRRDLRGRLRSILLHGYSFEGAEPQAAQNALLFSGCYFAATGEAEDRQAFVRNVFEKMLELEEDLEWTEEALAQDDNYHAWARFLMGASGLLVVAIIGMFAVKYLMP